MGFWSRINRWARRVRRGIGSYGKRVSGKIRRSVGGKVRRHYSKVKSWTKSGIKKKFTKVPKSELELKRLVDQVVDDVFRELLPLFPEAREDTTGETEEALKAEIYREVFIELDRLADEDEEESETRRT